MLMKPCPRCRRMMAYGPPYCADCRPIAEAELAVKREDNARRKSQQYNSRRDPKYLTFYRSKEWKITSRTKLQQAGYKCKAKLPGCTRLAVEVHHIKPIQTAEGWDLRLEWDNLEPVCTACHNGRHERFKRKQEDGVLDMREIMKKMHE